MPHRSGGIGACRTLRKEELKKKAPVFEPASTWEKKKGNRNREDTKPWVPEGGGRVPLQKEVAVPRRRVGGSKGKTAGH